MKANTKKKGNPAKKLIPAAGSLMVSAVMLATSTYAWFTMNKEVEVTGLTMKTKVSSNLLISSNNAAGSYKADQLVEGRQALLEPVSTVSGKTGSFFYTLDAAENGSKAHTADGTYVYKPYTEDDALANSATSDPIAGKYKYADDFDEAYGINGNGSTTAFATAYGYVDYVFYLKATGNEASQDLVMTACDLNYTAQVGGAAYDGTGDDAWRIAVFASTLADNQGGTGNTGAVGQIDPAASNAKVILKTSDSQGYFTADKAVASGTGLNFVDVTGSNSPTAANYGAAILDDDIGAGVTKYYKVLVRVWLEGEDKSCTTATYAKLTDQWTLDVEFKLVSNGSSETGETPVANITKNGFTPSITATQNAVTSPVEVAPGS
ncbi:MAG: hypothetical protein K6F71_09220 [Ruminococcus sp.]|uniref:hypothetical protein n=1 Tax=Ruminococcus sp. TaxID=41978 RepID=UPI0025EF7FFE|nr:hypothetical protein [Ruminococcus sp.]MCR5540978.1 hypothetical protein [Ruminococcus sp.]